MVAVASAMKVGAGTIGNALTISDSQSRTWTEVTNVSNTSSYAIGTRVWISNAVSATSTTITLDCGANDIHNYFLEVFEIANASPVIGNFVTNAAAATNGGYSATLPTAATAGDLVIYSRFIDEGPAGLTMSGAAWGMLAERDNGGGGGFAVAANPSLTGTTVTITDTNVANSVEVKSIGVAFAIKASTSNIQPFTVVPGVPGVCTNTTATTAAIPVFANSGTIHVSVDYQVGTAVQLYYNKGSGDTLVSQQSGPTTGTFTIDDGNQVYFMLLESFCGAPALAEVTLRDGSAFGDILAQFSLAVAGI